MLMDDKILVIMEHVFGTTLSMINRDFSEYPEHRVAFFKLLRVINLHCFPTLLKLGPDQLRILVDACLWAIKHDNRDVENAGLNTCLELINNMNEAEAGVANQFFQNFLVPMLQDVIFVLTDNDHKAGIFQLSF
jgi:exportin-1